ncbi:MAG: SpoIID/LytB domain-containing protein [Spirochaetaceae bacterium]|jgi:SpoIID/LytB domain protein|nr:SpoIID/LytB domain-containing protein [Spirochaetaceae bacterium]
MILDKSTAAAMSFPGFYMALGAFFVFTLIPYPAFSRGSRDQGQRKLSPLEAYYAGRVEAAAEGFGGGRNRLEDRTQLVVIHWELGEMIKAAELLEDLLKTAGLKPHEREELQLQLFYTYCLLNNYARAVPLRNAAERAVQGADDRSKAEFYFYAAMTYHETGNPERAIELYKKSLDINKWRPIGWYRLGLLLKDKDPREGEKCLQSCWDQDPSFTEVLLPLARLLMARQEWRRARDYLVAANARLPGNREISRALAEAREHAPGAGAGDGLSLIRREIRANPPKVKPAPPMPREGIIRIGLIERRTLVSVKAGGGFTINLAGNRSSLYTGTAREQFWVEWTKGAGNGTLTVRDKNNKTLIRTSVALAYELQSAEDTSIVAGVVNGAPGTNRTYRGALEFRPTPNGMTVVNIVPMEEYLYAVIPSEMPHSWPAEALKAQTIAARSYSIANRNQFADRGFDLFGTPHSMAYHGVGSENKKTTDAVDITRGMILMGGRQPLKAYFSANHGGYSEDSMTMWGYDAYMQAVPDKLIPLRAGFLPLDDLYRWIRDTPRSYSIVPRYSYVSAYRWEKWVTPAEIRRRLSKDPGEITQIISRGRGISGRITALEVRGSKEPVMVEGDAIWNAMGGLRSSLFTIRYKLARNGQVEYFVFQGAGYGHGIGLDQHGAAGMASAGFAAEEILRHYYPRAIMSRM